MTITVEYFAQAREAAGRASESLQVSQDCTVEELLRMLASSSDKLARLLLNTDGSFSSSLAVAVNDRQAQLPDLLGEGDEVLLMPAVSGG